MMFSPPSSFSRPSLAPNKSYSTASFAFFRKCIEKKSRKKQASRERWYNVRGTCTHNDTCLHKKTHKAQICKKKNSDDG